MNNGKAVRIALGIIVTALLLASLESHLDRTLVEMPAWQHLGYNAWATFSRQADLGNGRIFYPLEGIGGTLLILAAAIAFRFSPRRPWSVAIPVYGTVLMRVCLLLVTVKAAPAMLSLLRGSNDPAFLQQAFETFYLWDSIRAVFGALGGCAAIWALIALLSMSLRNAEPN